MIVIYVTTAIALIIFWYVIRSLYHHKKTNPKVGETWYTVVHHKSHPWDKAQIYYVTILDVEDYDYFTYVKFITKGCKETDVREIQVCDISRFRDAYYKVENDEELPKKIDDKEKIGLLEKKLEAFEAEIKRLKSLPQQISTKED